MKRTFFNPHTGNTETTTSMRMPQRHARFGAACYKTDAGGDDGKDDDESVKLLNKIKSIVSNELATRASKEEMPAIIGNHLKTVEKLPLDALRALADEKTGVMAKLVQMGTQIDELKNTGLGIKEDMSIRGQVMAWRESNKLALEKIASGEEATLKPMNIRAVASPMTPANTLNGSAYLPKPEYQAGIVDLVRPQPVFWDYIKKGRSSSATYVWVNKTNPQGAAGFIAPGVLKPGISFELETETSNAKKIAVSDKVATELLQDIEGMVDYIETEMRYQVFHKINTTLMTGVSSNTVPAGIQSLSTTYTLTGVSTTNPNNMDAIRAAVAQIRSGNLVGPVTVFIHPVDAANMDLAKATDSGVYMLPPFSSQDGKMIGGATIVEDNNVAIGHVQVALLDYYKIKIYQDYTVTWGWENDDFTKNLVTAIGEVRLHQFFSQNHTGAFIYDTFDNIIDAITAGV